MVSPCAVAGRDVVAAAAGSIDFRDGPYACQLRGEPEWWLVVQWRPV